MTEWSKVEDDLRRTYEEYVVTGKWSASDLDEHFGRAFGFSKASVRAKRRRMGLVDDEVADDIEPAEIPDDLPVDEMVADYVYDGGGMTQAELAGKYGLTRGEVRSLFKQLGVTKDSLPFGPGALVTEETDALVERTLNARARKVKVASRRKRIRSLEKENLELRGKLESEERAFETAKEIAHSLTPAIPVIDKDVGAGEAYRIHAPTADEHVGLLVWDEEAWGNNYDTDIACARLRAHAHALSNWIQSQPGRCERVHRTFVGDLIHALLGQTEHGTRLDQDTRGAKVWGELVETARYCIEALRPVCDYVGVQGARGNHDGTIEFFLFMQTLQLLYEDVPDVNITATPGRQASFYDGESLHVLDHGYGIGKLNSNKAALALDRAARQADVLGWKHAENVYVYIGHQHARETVAVDERLELIRLPALCEPDDFSSSLRYCATPGANAYRLDDSGRILDTRRFHVDSLDTVAKEVVV